MRNVNATVFAACVSAVSAFAAHPALVIVVDGLRPDYVSEDLMPNLHAAAKGGVFCEAHHAVYPTVTRVNSSSLSTGMYPKHHGIMGNSVYIPSVDDRRPLNTSERGNLLKIREAEGVLLTAPTLGERFDAAGLKLFACSAGSAGSSYLLNPEGAGAGIIHYNYTLPEARRIHAEEILGPEPPDATPSVGRNRYAGEAYTKIALGELHPDATYIWFTDPDHTAHAKGIGDPVTDESIRLVDDHIGRIIQAHKDKGLGVNVFVTSDHGFSTHLGGVRPAASLIQAKLKRNLSSNDVVLAGGAVYVNEGGDGKIEAIARVFMADPAIGAIFTRAKSPGSNEGFVPGTLSFDLIHWNHARSGDLLVGANWSDAANEAGYKGSTTLPGVAGHGTLSKWDVHNTLVAFGPDIKKGERSPVPSGNVDIAPTVAYLAGIDGHEDMDGRVLHELLLKGPAIEDVDIEQRDIHTANDDGSYTLHLSASIVEGKRYIDYAKPTRP